MKKAIGYKSEVLVSGEWGQNAVVWPDRESAEKAAANLYSRWTLTTDHRAVEVAEEPNRPTYEEHVAARGQARAGGPPPRSVTL